MTPSLVWLVETVDSNLLPQEVQATLFLKRHSDIEITEHLLECELYARIHS